MNSIIGEVRINVTDLFYPETVTQPGKTPLNLREISDKFDKRAIKDYGGKYSFCNIVFHNGCKTTWLCCAGDVNLLDVCNMLVNTAKDFYGNVIPDFDKCRVDEPDDLIQEYTITF